MDIERTNDEILWLKQTDELNHLLKENNIFFKSNMHGREVCMLGNASWNIDCEPEILIFEVKGIGRYFFKKNDSILYYSTAFSYCKEKAIFWLYHTIIPLFLMMKNYYEAILHCGGVEINGKAILFMASPMGGKSTLTNYFIDRGHKMISDDRIAISFNDNIYQAIPSYPFCRPYRNDEDLGKPITQIMDVPLPIHGIYVLEKTTQNADIEISKLKGIEKFRMLAQSNEVNFPYQKPRVLKVLANMANVIPIYKLTIPWDKNRLNEIYTVLLSHCK